VQDNWALIYAQERALEMKVPLLVVFTLHIIPHRANLRQYDFMFGGLKEVEKELTKLSIPFFLLEGKPQETLTAFITKNSVGEVVTDFSPLRYGRERRDRVVQLSPVRIREVDAHNVIPCFIASPKEEFAAYTFRPKVHRVLSQYLTDFPKVTTHPHTYAGEVKAIDWENVLLTLDIDRSVLPVTGIIPGAKAAQTQLDRFVSTILPTYDTDRNDPTKKAVSGLSPYLHFGQLSAQAVALKVKDLSDVPGDAKNSFLEELIVRKELADNYCFYNQAYDTVAGAHAWAQKSIAEHVGDSREYLYTKQQLESAATHDDLWNAMQVQMVSEGKMHGWCRMYWAKKILEWTPDVQTAIDIALYLNDKYELDGNDPNGVTGVMWSLCGVHDRAWNERLIFGKVRYMNYAGAKRKFAIAQYIQSYSNTTLFHD
jgi:deoxyribodipyrimidine photo-lyase